MTDLSTSAYGGDSSPSTSTSVAELHRLCRQDYDSAAPRRAQNHRDDAHLIAAASEAVNAR